MKKSIIIYMIKQHVNSYESSLEEIPNSLEFLEEKYNKYEIFNVSNKELEQITQHVQRFSGN